MTHRILVLEDDESLRLVVTKALGRAGYDVRATGSASSAIERVNRGEVDLLVADVVLERENFLDRIDEITRARPDVPIIVVSAQTTAATAINAARRGAHRYLPKPFDLDDLTSAVSDALQSAPKPANARARGPDGSFGGLVGQSRAMQATFQAVGRLATSRLPVLLTGPEGCGRATTARALHKARGGAGLVEAGPARIKARGLALFDDPADGVLLRRAEQWDVETQGIVLEFLESAPGYPVYATGTPHTRSELEPALFNRLAHAVICLPPLREREGDAPLLFERALLQAGRSGISLSRAAEDLLSRWTWPGEVLELERVAAQIAQRTQRGEVSVSELREALGSVDAHTPAGDLAGAVEQRTAEALRSGQADIGSLIGDVVDRVMIETALAHCNGVRRDAAARLGWNRNTLARRIATLGLSGQDED